jgi:hypothetical protein
VSVLRCDLARNVYCGSELHVSVRGVHFNISCTISNLR